MLRCWQCDNAIPRKEMTCFFIAKNILTYVIQLWKGCNITNCKIDFAGPVSWSTPVHIQCVCLEPLDQTNKKSLSHGHGASRVLICISLLPKSMLLVNAYRPWLASLRNLFFNVSSLRRRTEICVVRAPPENYLPRPFDGTWGLQLGLSRKFLRFFKVCRQ